MCKGPEVRGKELSDRERKRQVEWYADCPGSRGGQSAGFGPLVSGVLGKSFSSRRQRISSRRAAWSDLLLAGEIHGVPRWGADSKGGGEALGAPALEGVVTWAGEAWGWGEGDGRTEAQEVR